MSLKMSVATTFAFALAASPLAAQIVPRTDGGRRTDRTTDRVTTVEAAIEAARRRAGVYGERTDGHSGAGRIPKGHLPPAGMCRVWIDGVPPGHQPAPTSCAEAERDRFRYPNARVIHGDRERFPGKGKGKWDRKGDDRWDGAILRDDHDDGARATGKSRSKAAKRAKKAARG